MSGQMKDFMGILKFKLLILAIMILQIVFNFVGPIYFYQHYILVFSFLESIYFFKMFYFTVMVAIMTYQELKIIEEVQCKKKTSKTQHQIYYAITLPIYQQSLQILRNTISNLAGHQHSKQKYLIFLALQQNSQNPKQKGQQLKQQYQSEFRLMEFTIHSLQPGEAKGKASNLNYCLLRMQQILQRNRIDPSLVMFTTLDCDNVIHQVYFSEVEQYLDKHDWNMNKYVFAPHQMFAINNESIPISNRIADFILSSGVFAWSKTITKVHNAASNYSISFDTLKKIGFYDTNSDAICDDYHMSMKCLWKTNGYMEIIPIFVMVNMMSLETGKGYFSQMSARFWQSQRHLRGLLDASYNLNMFFKNPFNFKTFCATIFFIDTQLVNLNICLTMFTFFTFKIIQGLEFTDKDILLIRVEGIFSLFIYTMFYIIMNRSSKVLYKGKGVSVKLLIESIVLNKIVVFFYFVIPLIIASIRTTFTQPSYETAAKNSKIMKNK